MKKINLSAICAAALLLAIPFAGCGQGDSGSIEPHQDIELTQENDGNECPDGDCNDNGDKCPDGKCPKDGHGDKCPDGKCPKDGHGDKCHDGKCPKAGGRKPRQGRRAEPLPCPIDDNNN